MNDRTGRSHLYGNGVSDQEDKLVMMPHEIGDHGASEAPSRTILVLKDLTTP
jgi:hypothetical protein